MAWIRPIGAESCLYRKLRELFARNLCFYFRMGIGQRSWNIRGRTQDLDVPEAGFELTTAESAFALLQPAWAELLHAQTHPSPYWNWSYLRLWWATFGRRCPETGREGVLRVATIRHRRQVVAIFPMFVERGRWWSPFVRRLRFIGFNGATGPADMTEEPIYLVRPGFEREALQGLEAAIAELRRQDAYDLLDLRIWQRTPVAFRLPHRVKKGPIVADLPATWTEYRQVLSKSMRDNLNYYPRLLTRHGHAFEVEIARENADLWVDDLVRLHRIRCQTSTDRKRVDHFPGTLQQEFQAETLRSVESAFVARLKIDGNSVAAQSYLELGSTLLVGYSGFDPAWSAYSPLLVLQAEVFAQANARGVRRLDFQQGDKAWQTRWQAKPEGHILAATVCRKNPVSLLKAAAYFATREMRRLGRRFRIAPTGTERFMVAFGANLGRMAHQVALHLPHLAAHPAVAHVARAR